MFLGTFLVSSGPHQALLRIDLLEGGAIGLYELVDQDGQSHTWQWPLTEDTESKSFAERAWYAVARYVTDCQGRDWVGTIEPVLLAMGLDAGPFHCLASLVDPVVPIGETIQ